MNTIRFSLVFLLLLAGTFGVRDARAAESYDNCTGFVDTLPAQIGTQGTWCLRKDLSTAQASGNAIYITTNNVTLDCNGFKLGGLAAGTGSTAYGVFAYGMTNLTVRNCNVRGFWAGINLFASNSLVEDNSLDGNLYIGIQLLGIANQVLRNTVYNTGGGTNSSQSFGLRVTGDSNGNGGGRVLDNTVAGVFGTTVDTSPVGIFLQGAGLEAARNRVRGLVVAGGGFARGIYAGVGVTVDRNHVAQAADTNGDGIASYTGSMFCSRNTVANFSNAYAGCGANLGNLTLP
ncbi:MAG TPA: right-handed parallel beta-helix repeat-containing protein [Lysobacter sp.]